MREEKDSCVRRGVSRMEFDKRMALTYNIFNKTAGR